MPLAFSLASFSTIILHLRILCVAWANPLNFHTSAVINNVLHSFINHYHRTRIGRLVHYQAAKQRIAW